MSVLWFQRALLPSGWADGARVEVENGLISRVEAGIEPGAGDERGDVAVLGLANVHSHAFQRGMAGLTERRGPSADDDFWTWRELMYRFLDRLTPDDVEAIAAQAYAEMLEAGFTRVGEFHYLHHDPAGAPYADPAELAGRVIAAAEATGIGLTLLPVYYAQGGFGGAPPKPSQRRFINNIGSFEVILELSRKALESLEDGVLGVAPHSLRAVTAQDLAQVTALLPDGPIHIHAAEQVREVEACVAWSGRRPVEWLLDNAGVDRRWCLVHATHASDEELARLAASGAVAGLCPITEANLGDGIFGAEGYLAAGGAFGLGSDSNVQIDAAQELRMLEYGQRLTRRARNRLAAPGRPSAGASLFAGALAGGAQALGVGRFGLEAGASADIVELDARHPCLVGRNGDALLDSWIFAGTPGVVRTVWRRGRKVVREGRHLAFARIAETYRKTLLRLLAA